MPPIPAAFILDRNARIVHDGARNTKECNISANTENGTLVAARDLLRPSDHATSWTHCGKCVNLDELAPPPAPEEEEAAVEEPAE